jgi:hypothetical protein
MLYGRKTALTHKDHLMTIAIVGGIRKGSTDEVDFQGQKFSAFLGIKKILLNFQ